MVFDSDFVLRYYLTVSTPLWGTLEMDFSPFRNKFNDEVVLWNTGETGKHARILDQEEDQNRFLYIHGWGSRFDPDSQKVRALNNIGHVYGVNLDYTMPFGDVAAKIEKRIENVKPDALIGTSLGGYWAAQIGQKTGIPFISINPATDPGTTLRKYLGKGNTYFGEQYELTENILNDYKSYSKSGKGLILLDLGDELLNSGETKKDLNKLFPIKTFPGGSHRFAHMAESLDTIQQFLSK
jgi:predicted esterase YcpF (UPF0227 family)